MSADLGHLISRIAEVKTSLGTDTADTLSEQTLEHRGLRGVKEDAFVKIAAKVERYVDVSLELRANSIFDGLPPTELKKENGRFVPKEFGSGIGVYRTTALDQQRQLYAAAQLVMLDPAYGDSIASDLVEWHDAFVRNFVVGGQNPRVRASVISSPNGRLDPQEPDPKANLRLTYAVQGSATLARALNSAAHRSSDPNKSRMYGSKAGELRTLALEIGEQFHRDYADRQRPGRYFLYPSSRHDDIPDLRGLSHNNSQSYLIEGMRALAALYPARWQKRLEELLHFIGTQRDPVSGLLHEFSFKSFDDKFPSDAIGQVEDLRWQSRDGNETVILGHTLAGLYAGPGKLIADFSDAGKLQPMIFLIQDFVETMSRLDGIHENGLPANGFELICNVDTPFREVAEWPEGAWQTELLWQFLLHADRCGVDLAKFEVRLGKGTLTLDRLLARSLAFHDKYLFNGTSYVDENGKPLVGRDSGAPINHAADTLRDLSDNLSAMGPFCHRFTANEVTAYVHKIFGFFDKHVEVQEIIPYLSSKDLGMDFPGCRIRCHGDFRSWYEEIGQQVYWNVHRIERADIAVIAHRKYQIELVLLWEGAYKKDGRPFSYRVNQIWRLVEADNVPLQIERYRVTGFESLPAPS